MKKLFCVCMIVMMLCTLAACEGEKSTENKDLTTAESAKLTDSIDVDLTTLSSTMVYAEVYNMMVTPSDYIGKTVKMGGQFALYQAVDKNGDPITDQIYFACIISDATACCSQGIEFILAGEHSYPEDYPELGSSITVTGIFQTYVENGNLYCNLVDAVME